MILPGRASPHSAAGPAAVPYPRHAVSTRKLIVVALVCGLAILVAGGIQLFRIAGTDDRTVEVLAEGEAATVGSVTVSVEGSEHDGAVIRAMVRLSAPDETTVPLSSFTLLAGGLSNTELAGALQLSEATVKTHITRILTKLQLRDRVQAVVVAYQTGLVTPSTRPDAS